MRVRQTPQQKAERLAGELDSGDWPEDAEPQEVAWLLRELLKLIFTLQEPK